MKHFQQIKIKVLTNEINEILPLLGAIEYSDTKMNKTRGSILSQVNIKLTRKMLTSVAQKKEFNLKLEFYEAYFLEELLRIALGVESNRYFQTLADKLHQKLA